MPERFKMAKREYVPNPAKFDGISTNAQDYKANEMIPRSIGGPHKNNLEVGGDFSGDSEK